jgi:glycosyltransferase involved in cell wall biosynthesis
LKVLVHDFAGHPFQIQLSRALAGKGLDVCHAYCESLVTTPRGEMRRNAHDSNRLAIVPISLGEPLEKYRFLTRWRQEHTYGRLLASVLERERPDVLLSGNTPLDSQRILFESADTLDIPVVYWVQDLIGIAAARLLRARWIGLGALAGNHYARLERRLLRRSAHSVVISEDFVPLLERFGVPAHRITVIENWGPIEDIPVRARDNEWASRHGLVGRTVFLYSGTLGLKHNPALLLELARRHEDASVVVVSQGRGADWLREQKQRLGAGNLTVLDFQPFDALPDVLGSADVLVAILESDADAFSVPSKVLTYLCARRPLLLAVPGGNLAAKIVERIGAGIVVPPTDPESFLTAAAALLRDPSRRANMAEKGRKYAERTFQIEDIAARFESVLNRVAQT